MRKICIIWLAITLLSLIIQIGNTAPVPPTVTSKSAILIDAVTGKVLYEKRCHAQRPPASTTKIMTAILAIENGDLDKQIYASENAAKTRFCSLHLKPGEVLTLRYMLYGLLVRSANDSAVSIAENIGGSEANFVKMMNEKAKAIGAKDTHFVNPHGLHKPGHYSSAYDLALFARYATQYPVFNEMVNTRAIRIERSINYEDVTLRNTAKFLKKYNGADGIKTGYTRQAGRCFVGSVTRNGWRLISVSLGSKDAGEDTAAIMNYGFKYFKQVPFARANQIATTVPVKDGIIDKIGLVADKNLAIVIRKTAPADSRIDIDVSSVSAPFEKGEKLGTLTGYLNGEEVGTVDLLASESVERTFTATLWWYTRFLLIIFSLSFAGYIVYGTAVAKTARRRRRSFTARI